MACDVLASSDIMKMNDVADDPPVSGLLTNSPYSGNVALQILSAMNLAIQSRGLLNFVTHLRLWAQRRSFVFLSSIMIVIKSSSKRWRGHVARMGEMRNAFKIFFGIIEGKRPLGRTRRRWEVIIRMNFREIGWEVVD